MFYRSTVPDDADPKTDKDSHVSNAKFYDMKKLIKSKSRFAFDHFEVFKKLYGAYELEDKESIEEDKDLLIHLWDPQEEPEAYRSDSNS